MSLSVPPKSHVFAGQITPLQVPLEHLLLPAVHPLAACRICVGLDAKALIPRSDQAEHARMRLGEWAGYCAPKQRLRARGPRAAVRRHKIDDTLPPSGPLADGISSVGHEDLDALGFEAPAEDDTGLREEGREAG